jgi:hypothetical protein
MLDGRRGLGVRLRFTIFCDGAEKRFNTEGAEDGAQRSRRRDDDMDGGGIGGGGGRWA